MGRTGTAASAPRALQVQTVGSVSINLASTSFLIRVLNLKSESVPHCRALSKWKV